MSRSVENDAPPCPVCAGSMRFCECMDDPFASVPDNTEKDAGACEHDWVFDGYFWHRCRNCGRVS